MDYVRYWPVYQRYGNDLFLAGYKEHILSYMAAAVVNEVVMRYAPVADVSCFWFNVRNGLPWALDVRKNSYTEHATFKNRLTTSSLLWVENPLDVIPEGTFFLDSIYQTRLDALRPTISTFVFSKDSLPQEQVVQKLGKRFLKARKESTIIVFDNNHGNREVTASH